MIKTDDFFLFHWGAHDDLVPFSGLILQFLWCCGEKVLTFFFFSNNFQWKECFTELRWQPVLCTVVSLWQPYLVLHRVSLHCYYVPTHSHTDAQTHTSLLTPAGPLESWRRQALAGMYPDIPPSWQPVSDAPAARRAEAQLQSDARHNRSPAPLSGVIDFFSMESVFSQLAQVWGLGFLPAWMSPDLSILCFDRVYVHFVCRYGWK